MSSVANLKINIHFNFYIIMLIQLIQLRVSFMVL